ncbi:unnamed protein product [Ceutorhynchus assimilis]|uniref:Uncharacterized protein n=1 Tax=Ceutorhynchus assimilis TaxID=467358 RepID=A0A9N9MH65_9CUCU|nr:unnamed protein product [Ceutorhynchus assimilis]
MYSGKKIIKRSKKKQTYLLIDGDNLETIRTVYIVIDRLKYQFSSVTEASGKEKTKEKYTPNLENAKQNIKKKLKIPEKRKTVVKTQDLAESESETENPFSEDEEDDCACIDCTQNFTKCPNESCRSVSRNPSISAPVESEWLQCVPCGLHRRGQLMMTEIIPEKILHVIGKRFHETRDLWSIDKFCRCRDSKESGINNPENREAVQCALAKRKTTLQSSSSGEDFCSDEEDDALHLRRTLLGPVPVKEKEATSKNKHQGPVLLRNERPNKKQGQIRITTQMVSTLLNPDIPHSWLCVGKLLRLTDPGCEDNLKMFQIYEESHKLRNVTQKHGMNSVCAALCGNLEMAADNISKPAVFGLENKSFLSNVIDNMEDVTIKSVIDASDNQPTACEEQQPAARKKQSMDLYYVLLNEHISTTSKGLQVIAISIQAVAEAINNVASAIQQSKE